MNEITFTDAMNMIRTLVHEKKFPDNPEALGSKLLWAFVELGEAADAYKKGEDFDKVAEELIDTIFYILDFMGIVNRDIKPINPDQVFIDKWRKNMGRPNRYGQKREISSTQEK